MQISISGTVSRPINNQLSQLNGVKSVPFTDEVFSLTLQSDPAIYKLVNRIKALGLSEIRVEIDTGLGAIWCFQQHKVRPNFVLSLLRDIRLIQRCLQDFHRDYPRDAEKAVRFLIWGSDIPGIFNLGGDLGYFLQLIETQDHASMMAYALSCIDVCYSNYCGIFSSVIVTALVAGDALGGGFESALSCDFIVAEEQARFGLPEILYGLFPGMGAYSFLARRIGQAKAETMIFDGRVHSAAEIKDNNLIEIIASTGRGRATMEEQLLKIGNRFNAAISLYRAKRRTSPVTYSEMTDIARDWVSTAFSLSKRDLRKIQKLVSAQHSRRALVSDLKRGLSSNE